MSIESIREDYREDYLKELVDLFREAAGPSDSHLLGRVRHAVVQNDPSFTISMKPSSSALEEWMRPALAEILATTRAALGAVPVHHMDVHVTSEVLPVGDDDTCTPFGPFLYLKFHFNPEAAAEKPVAPEPKQNWLSALLGRPKPVAPVSETPRFIMTLE